MTFFRRSHFVIALLGCLLAIVGPDAWAQAPPSAIPTVSHDNVARHGFFYAGGKYVGEPGREVMHGAMYVEVMVPREIRQPYPIVFLHGAGQTGVDWLQTADGRPGWAYDFLDMGYVVYLEDYPARGRSAYVPSYDGNLNIRTAPNLEEIFTASAARADFPQAHKHTQWPGSGLMGDKIFDDFVKTQVQFMGGGGAETQDEMVRDANVALLDMLDTPVILLTHSQGGMFGWLIADARPNLVKAIVTAEPAAPPIRGVDTSAVAYRDGGGLSWGVSNAPITYEPPADTAADLRVALEPEPDGPGLVPCYLQQEPARKLVNLQGIPVLFLNAEGGYHRIYDHCLAKWLNQAGVQTQYVRMEEVGLAGNGHQMMLELNSKEIAAYIGEWLEQTVR
jgi:pimeloyl-ACP methyl ester carboxylesterase